MFLGILVIAFALAIPGCGSGTDSSDTGSNPALQNPGACVCYDGYFNVHSCVVTTNYQTCRSTVTTCNPFFYANSDYSHWCPSTSQGCY
jgi:hypothetical protein